MTMLQQLTGAPKDKLTKLSQIIGTILDKVNIKQEDQSDKIDMLRKIEFQLNFLLEAKEYIKLGPKRRELEDKMKELNTRHKEDRIKRKKADEQALDDERQRRNMEKIRKQDVFKFFKGKVQMYRGKKQDLQPKETNNELPSQEVLD